MEVFCSDSRGACFGGRVDGGGVVDSDAVDGEGGGFFEEGGAGDVDVPVPVIVD